MCYYFTKSIKIYLIIDKTGLIIDKTGLIIDKTGLIINKTSLKLTFNSEIFGQRSGGQEDIVEESEVRGEVNNEKLMVILFILFYWVIL